MNKYITHLQNMNDLTPLFKNAIIKLDKKSVLSSITHQRLLKKGGCHVYGIENNPVCPTCPNHFFRDFKPKPGRFGLGCFRRDRFNILLPGLEAGSYGSTRRQSGKFLRRQGVR